MLTGSTPWWNRRWLWLAGLGLGFLLRFPGNFLLHPPFLMDLDVYRAVALRVVQGQAAALYDPTSSAVMLFKYAPCWALAWIPLAWIPAQPAAVAWAALTVGWLVLSCWAGLELCRRAGVDDPPWLIVAAMFLLVRSLTAEFLNGQVDLLWGLLVIGFLLAEDAGRMWLAAALLALGISLKLPAAVVLLYLLLSRRWATAGRTVAWLVGFNALSSFAMQPGRPLHLFGDWIRVLLSSGAGRAFEIGNQSLLALLGRFLMAGPYGLHVASWPATMIVELYAATSLILLGLVVWPRQPAGERRTRLIYDGALLMVLMALCSPTVWVATYSALLFPAMLALSNLWTTRRCFPSLLGSLAAGLLLLGLSIMTHSALWRAIGMRSIRGETYVFLVLMILPWFALALFGTLWVQRRRMLRRPGA